MRTLRQTCCSAVLLLGLAVFAAPAQAQPAGVLRVAVGADPATVLETLAETGSLIRTIDRLNGGDRRLVGFPALASSGPRRPQLGTRLLDPIAPFGTAAWWRGRFSCS